MYREKLPEKLPHSIDSYGRDLQRHPLFNPNANAVPARSDHCIWFVQVGSRAPRAAKNSGTTIGAGKYKTDGALRGIDKNIQNVPTLAVVAVPILLYVGLDFFGKTWGT